MTGIYKITNIINNKSYIGASIDIEERWKTHKQRAFSNSINNSEYNKSLYRAFRKYKLENFIFEILEITNSDELFEKEKYYIQYYDTYENGYNETLGGEGVTSGINYGENHPKTLLTEQDVIYIRDCYNNHKEQMEIFKEFQNKIGISGFRKIWNGETWKKTHMDVYTSENKQFYFKQRQSKPCQKNGMAKLTNEDVINIRTRKKNGEQLKQVYENYKDKVTYGSFSNVWHGYNWKNIIV